jgi:hypothetical protein
MERFILPDARKESMRMKKVYDDRLVLMSIAVYSYSKIASDLSSFLLDMI